MPQITRAEDGQIKKHWTMEEAEAAEEKRRAEHLAKHVRQVDFSMMNGWRRLWLLSIGREK